MPITPYTTPVQFEYRPLNIQAFAAPLAKMQEEFDITTAKVADADFNLEHLPYGTDPERAKALLETVKGKQDELAKNLLETKNYKQAAIKLQELNKLWKTDPELNALQTNYKTWQELDKEQKARMDKGELSRDQYLQWKERSIRDYSGVGGASFQADYMNPEGTYQTIGRVGRLKDLEKDLEDMSWKVASAVEGDKRESALRAIGIDPEIMDKHFRKTIIEERSQKKVADAVQGYLRTLPRFKEWGEEVADYNYDALQQDPSQYAEEAGKINDKYISLIDEELKSYKGDKNSQEYKAIQEAKKEAMDAKITGKYNDNVIKNLYTQEHMNEMYDMTKLGKVFEYKKLSSEDQFKDLYIPKDGDGSGGSSIFGKDAFFHPETDVKYNVGTFQQQMKDNATPLYGRIKTLHDYAGGNVRKAILGNLSPAEQKRLTNDPSAMLVRNENLLSSFQNSGTVNDFIKNAKSKGINMTQDVANSIWKNWKSNNGVGVNQFANTIQGVKTQANIYSSAQENLKNLRSDIQKTAEWDNGIKTLGNSMAGRDVTTEQARLFDGTRYSKEALKKAGVSIPQGRTFHPLTFNQVAKLHGYKDVEDAINKGYKFGNVSIADKTGTGFLGKSVNDYVMGLENSITPSLASNERGFNLLNTPQISKELSQMTTTIDELMQQDPAYKTSWKGIAGFDEEGKPLSGTQLVVDDAHKPVLHTHGNNLFFKYYYKYNDDNGKPVIKSVIVKPKTGTIKRNSQTIDNLLIQASGEDQASKSTKAQLLKMKFDVVYPNNLTSSTFNAVPVNSGQKKSLGTIEVDNNQKISFMKEFYPGAMEPVVTLYVVGADNKPIQINKDGSLGGSSSQKFSSNDILKAKEFVSSMLLDVQPEEAE
jgi:hypothetical protein